MTIYRPIQLSEENRETCTERFWGRVLILGPDDCWPWQRARDGDGYGIFNIPGRNVRAARFAYYLTHGNEPSECTMHTCDNPPCCNPAHLKSGTYDDNNRDMRNKGRSRVGDTSNRRRGSHHLDAKLTEADIPVIRALSASGMSGRAIARQYSMDHMNVRKILMRVTWKHVP